MADDDVEQRFLSLLDSLTTQGLVDRSNSIQGVVLKDLEALHSLVISSKARDVDFASSSSTSPALPLLLKFAISFLSSDIFPTLSASTNNGQNQTGLKLYIEIFLTLFKYPEISALSKPIKKQFFDPCLFRASLYRAAALSNFVSKSQNEGQASASSQTQNVEIVQNIITEELTLLCQFCHEAYMMANTPNRRGMRQILGSVLQASCSSSATNSELIRDTEYAINLCLQLCGYIIQGFTIPLSNVNRSLLLDVLLPFHKIPGKITHQKPLLELVHKNLLYCIMCFLDKEKKLVEKVFESVLNNWPDNWAGNTPKEILLLNEIESLLEHPSAKILFESDDSGVGNILLQKKLLTRISMCLASDHSVVCQRSLLLWQNDKIFNVLNLTPKVSEDVLRIVVPVLCNKSLKHWNQTVVKMTVLVIRKYVDSKSIDSNQDLLWELLGDNLYDVEFNLQVQTEAAKGDKVTLAKSTMNSLFEKYVEGPSTESGKKRDNAANEAAGGDINGDIAVFVPQKLLDLKVTNMVLGEELGSGSFGSVFECFKVVKEEPRKNWPRFALKEISKAHEKYAMREIHYMDLISHPNCVALVGYYLTSSTINLVIEFAGKGDLHSILVDRISLIPENVRFTTGEISAALNCFHENGLIFGDLKPENVLIFDNDHVKLCDYGAVRKVEDVKKGAPMEGTLMYLAPELLIANAASFASDYWSLGCLVFQMHVGKPPFVEHDAQLMLNEFIHDEFEFTNSFKNGATERSVSFNNNAIKMEKLNLNSSEIDNDVEKTTTSIRQVINSLLQQNPLNRPNFGQLQKLPLFSDFELDFTQLHKVKAPEFVSATVKNDLKGSTASSTENKPWTQRSYSMMISPVPKKYNFASDQQTMLKIIPEETTEKNLPWLSSNSMEVMPHFKFDVLRIDPNSILIPESDDGKLRKHEVNVPMAIMPKSNIGKNVAAFLLKKNNINNPQASLELASLGVNNGIGGSSSDGVAVGGKSGGPQKKKLNPADFQTVAPHMLNNKTKQKKNARDNFSINGLDLSAG